MKKILLATNSEYGQANVFLAAGHALQAADVDVQIHFVSFAAIAKDVSSASQYSTQCTPGAQPWNFHELDGASFWQMLTGPKGTDLGAILNKRPTFFSVLGVLSQLMPLLLPWNETEFVRIYQSFARLVDELQPDMIVVDSLFSPVLTACRRLELKHLVLSPNTLKDFATALQPWGAMFWKFPVMGSALEFPVPWRSIPANIVFCFAQIYYALTARNVRDVGAHVKRELGADVITFETLMFRPLPGQKVLVANRPEIEFPLAVIPKHLTACGPIIRPVPSVAEVDPELAAWLKRGPTVFICLGTHRIMETEDEALEMAGAIHQLLEAEKQKGGGRLQVLWKLMTADKGETATYEVGPGTRVYTFLQQVLDSDRVRIVDWVKPQPSAVLQAGTVVCSVNHGGANSFHDALTSGVPQVVLPGWLDCYDFASRAEILGIGRWGNKKAMPQCTAAELGPILVDVVLGPKSQSIKARVEELAALCAKTPGVSVAAAAILDEIENKKSK